MMITRVEQITEPNWQAMLFYAGMKIAEAESLLKEGLDDEARKVLVGVRIYIERAAYKPTFTVDERKDLLG